MPMEERSSGEIEGIATKILAREPLVDEAIKAVVPVSGEKFNSLLADAKKPGRLRPQRRSEKGPTMAEKEDEDEEAEGGSAGEIKSIKGFNRDLTCNGYQFEGQDLRA
jgi:hypothetical protein